jgi:hypothetical protein
VPAAAPRRHRLEDLAAAVQDADAGRAVGLVGGPGVEVGVDRGEVTGIWGTACEPSTRTSAPAACARRAISSTGLIVPRTFETWATATSFGPLARCASSSSSSSRPLVVDAHDVEVRAPLSADHVQRDG